MRPCRSSSRAGSIASQLAVEPSHAEAGGSRNRADPVLPPGPEAGFYGRDETLLALDRAFDTNRVVLLHGYAGAGKTSTALEFARWYTLTSGVDDALFTQFTQDMPLARLLGQVRSHFGPSLIGKGAQWAALDKDKWDKLDEADRRDTALLVLNHVGVMWVWDNVEEVAGFPPGIPDAPTAAKRQELTEFLMGLARHTRCKVLLTSRRDEWDWLGNLPTRWSLPRMPMLERLELAQAVAGRAGFGRQFLKAADWRPLLDFTQGNPLTITVLLKQVIRDHRTTREQIAAFVAELAAGAAEIIDDPAQGRSASLAASLSYGLTHSFTEVEHAILALLALFQGFAEADNLCRMGNPGLDGGPVQAVAGLDRDAGIDLLNRAAEIGLLTAQGSGRYTVHPAIPWLLQPLFAQHYGPPGSPPAMHATRAWTTAIRDLGDYCHRQHEAGHADVINVLAQQEANLLRARSLALAHSWLDLFLGPMRGLQSLYEQTGRAVEWRRLVTELTPVFTDPATDGPLPGLEHEWAILTSYQVRIIRRARNWSEARQLLEALITWCRKQAGAALDVPAGELDEEQRGQIRTLAADLHDLGQTMREQDDPGCLQPYREAIGLLQQIGARREEATVALNMGAAFLDVPRLRDLDQAEVWYLRNLQLQEPHDTLNRARVTGQLARVAYERFVDAAAAGAGQEQLNAYRKKAAAAYHQALALFPADDVSDRAIGHGQLGFIYGDAGDIKQALDHYQQAIQYGERADNRYLAGNFRYNAALDLQSAGRSNDAVLYARAALRDYESLGPGAAARASAARQLITELEREPLR